MTIDDPSSPTPDPATGVPKLSRRSILTGLGFGAAAIVVAKTGSSAGAVADELNQPGRALETAQRVTTTTTSTTTTIPGATTVPGGTTTTLPGDSDDPDGDGDYDTSLAEVAITAADGEIPFPIVVGEGDGCYVLNNFGDPRGCCRNHEGVDIMADRGLPIIAVVDGTLTKLYEDYGSTGGAGHGWTLSDDENDVDYKFFHMDAHRAGLAEGDTVVAGQVIGYVGETGTSGAGSTVDNFHLHFEYRPRGNAANSFALLERQEHTVFAS